MFRLSVALVATVIAAATITVPQANASTCPAGMTAVTGLDNVCEQAFTVNGEFTVPTGANFIEVLLAGGGGAGGKGGFVDGAPGPSSGSGGGGGGGGQVKIVEPSAVAGTQYRITIGQGGSREGGTGRPGSETTVEFGPGKLDPTLQSAAGGEVGTAGGQPGAGGNGGSAGGIGAPAGGLGSSNQEGGGGGGGGFGGTGALGGNPPAEPHSQNGGAGGSGGAGTNPTTANLFPTDGEFYGGGGGGGGGGASFPDTTKPGAGGSGGNGGGGSGGFMGAGGNGTVNRGGGGGGGASVGSDPGLGGSGIVLIRVRLNALEPGPPTPPAPAPAPAQPAPAPAPPAPTVLPTVPVSIPPGEAVAQVGGQPLAVTTTPLAPSVTPSGGGSGVGGLVSNGVRVSGGGVQMTASGPSVAGNFSGTGVSVPAAGPMALGAAGFTAGSPVAVYLIVEGQDPILLGSVTANSNGQLSSQVQIPGNIRPGSAVIQIDGTNANNESLSISLGIEVQDAVAPQTRASGNLPAPAPGRAVALDAQGKPLPGSSVSVGDGVVRMNTAGSAATIRTVAATGASLPTSAGLSVGEDGFVRVSANGFTPDSRVAVWGFSTPVLIGLVFTDANGRYDATLPLTGMPTVGQHTLQSTGTDRRGASVSLTTGIRIQGSDGESEADPASQPQKQITAQKRVTFDRLSTTVRSADRDALRKLVERIGASNIVSTNVIGYVQISGDSNNDSALSRARARSTAAVLRSLGVQGKVTTSGNGVLKAPSSQARSAVVTFTYRK